MDQIGISLTNQVDAPLQVVPEGQPAPLQRGEALLLLGGGGALDHALVGHVPARLEQVLTAPAQLVDERRAILSQGGNTSMVGGATPAADGSEIVLSLGRMNRVREIDQVDLRSLA